MIAIGSSAIGPTAAGASGAGGAAGAGAIACSTRYRPIAAAVHAQDRERVAVVAVHDGLHRARVGAAEVAPLERIVSLEHRHCSCRRSLPKRERMPESGILSHAGRFAAS